MHGTQTLDGVYTLKQEPQIKEIESPCISNCIYSRDGDEFIGQEYCFAKDSENSAAIEDHCSPQKSGNSVTVTLAQFTDINIKAEILGRKYVSSRCDWA